MTSPYGTWKSPITAARASAGALRLDHIVVDGEDVYWAEGRASEGGRTVVVRRTPDGRITDVTPPSMNVRSRVHEYGGSPYTVHKGTVYFSNYEDQRLYRSVRTGQAEAITAPGYFYAECRVDEGRGRLLCVREDHTRGDAEPVNTIVAVPIAPPRSTAGRVATAPVDLVLVSGADFYSDPALSPDGSQLAWLQWRHPNMPWDGTELWMARIGGDGRLTEAAIVAGGVDESIFQPEWSPDGLLYFVSDITGWWNLYRRRDGATEAIYPMAAEVGKAQWTFSSSSYAFIDAGRLALTYTQKGRWYMALVELAPRKFEPIDLVLEPLDSVRATSRAVYFIGGSPTEAPAIAQMSLAAAEAEVIRRSSHEEIAAAWLSTPEAITFPSRGANPAEKEEPVHAFYYRPTNPDVNAPVDQKPPLLVTTHGGPTGAALDVLDPRVQFWTSRGFAVLDVNYRGSTGHGRQYRDRLNGQWGVVDVADVVNGARYLVERGLADPERLIVRGGSAGGFTALAALTFYDVFRAGASYYGISDIEVLARDTHKFESRYLDTLVGPYPEARERYVQRSPIHFVDRLSCALILFQGLEDKVVPPNQSALMADAVRRKGLPVAYITFPDEQHGFRQAENIVKSLEGELFFYGEVFDFKPADTLVPIQIDNLPAR